MNILKKYAEELAGIALQRANSKHPPFADDQHGWVVLLEEIEECEKELNAVKGYHKMAWTELKKDECADGYIKAMRNRAINLIAEASQVAAMCDKYQNKSDR